MQLVITTDSCTQCTQLLLQYLTSCYSNSSTFEVFCSACSVQGVLFFFLIVSAYCIGFNRNKQAQTLGSYHPNINILFQCVQNIQSNYVMLHMTMTQHIFSQLASQLSLTQHHCLSSSTSESSVLQPKDIPGVAASIVHAANRSFPLFPPSNPFTHSLVHCHPFPRSLSPILPQTQSTSYYTLSLPSFVRLQQREVSTKAYTISSVILHSHSDICDFSSYPPLSAPAMLYMTLQFTPHTGWWRDTLHCLKMVTSEKKANQC